MNVKDAYARLSEMHITIRIHIKQVGKIVYMLRSLE